MAARIVSGPALSGRAPSGKAARHEDIQVQRDRRRHHISRPPGAVQATGISRVNSNHQGDHRKHAEYVRPQNAMKREEEAGDTCKRVVTIKNQVQPFRRFAENIPEQNHQSGKNTHETQSTCAVVNGDAVKPEINLLSPYPIEIAVLGCQRAQVPPRRHCPASCLKHFPRWSRLLVVQARGTN